MALYPGQSAFRDKPALSSGPPPPDPVPAFRFIPSYGFNLASSVISDSTQRSRVATDIIDIFNATSGGASPIHAHVAANWSWDEAETAFGVYALGPGSPSGVPERLKAIITTARAGGAVNSLWFLKLFYRNYNFTVGGPSSPCVPAYMQGGSTHGGLNSFAGTTGGTANSANGEYEGEHKNAVSRNAKMWVPAVQARLQAWLDAISAQYNSDPTFGGVIINETSQLPAGANRTIDLLSGETAVTGMSVPSQPLSVRPTDHAPTLATYFQNFFQACVNAKTGFSQCELIISPNTPSTIWTATPLNPGNLASDHKIGVYIQDGYKASGLAPKGSVQLLYTNNQPIAILKASYSVLLSGEVSSHKGVTGTEATTADAVTLSTGAKSFVIQKNKAIAVGDVINLMFNPNTPTTDYMSGTVTGYAKTTTGILDVSITAKVGSGSRTGWYVATGADYYPPHTLPEILEYAVTPFTAPWLFTPRWGTHSFAGASYVWFQVNAARTGTSETEVRYMNQVAELKTTSYRPTPTRPFNYPA